MTGLIARLRRARTPLIIALSFVTLAFAANASAANAHRTASTHAHPKVVKSKAAHRTHKAIKHRRPRVTHHPVKHHAAPAPQHRRAKGTHRKPRTNANRPRRIEPPRLLASCGYTPRAVRTLHSRAAYVVDVDSGTPLLARNARTVRPIASISKLMTALQ